MLGLDNSTAWLTSTQLNCSASYKTVCLVVWALPKISLLHVLYFALMAFWEGEDTALNSVSRGTVEDRHQYAFFQLLI